MKALLMALVVVAGCSPPTTSWRGFPVREIAVAGRTLTVAVASTGAQQAKGLGGVTTLDGIDGMLFEFSDVTTTRFWMKDTLLPLDIAFFRSDGTLIEVLTMPICPSVPCPTYGPSDPYRWAVEAPTGGFLSTLPAGAILIPRPDRENQVEFSLSEKSPCWLHSDRFPRRIAEPCSVERRGLPREADVQRRWNAKL